MADDIRSQTGGSIQRHKCELVHINLQQNGLVIDIQRSSIMWTRYELVSFGFVAVVTLTGVGLLSTLLIPSLFF
jgi:hypothetical protein